MNKTFESLMLGSIEKQFLDRFAGEIQIEKYHLQNEIIERDRIAPLAANVNSLSYCKNSAS